MSQDGLDRVQEYLAKLPDGLESYPRAQVKNSVVRAWIDGHDWGALEAAVPAAVRPLCRGDLAVTKWVSEVHATVVYLTLRELFFADDDAFVRDAHERNRKLLSGPMYRMLVNLLSTRRIAKGCRPAFGLMHRGVVTDVDVAPWPWVWTLRYPAHLVPEVLGRCYGTVIVTALELSGKREVSVSRLDETPTQLRLAVEFTER